MSHDDENGLETVWTRAGVFAEEHEKNGANEDNVRTRPSPVPNDFLYARNKTVLNRVHVHCVTRLATGSFANVAAGRANCVSTVHEFLVFIS